VDDATYRKVWGDRDFKRILFQLGSDGTAYRQANPAIVGVGREDQSRASPRLLMPRLRV
jgi:hypothetical protein